MSDPTSPRSSSRNDWLGAHLAAWPDVQQSEADHDAAHDAIMDRIAAGDRGTSFASIDDGKIFSSPLGQTPEESHNTAASAAAKSTTSAAPASGRARGKSEESMSMSSDRERDRRSLQDLAKLAANTTPAPSSVRFDTGPLSSPSSSRKDEDSGLVNLMAFAPAPAAEPAPASAKAPPPPPPSASVPAATAAPASVRPSAPPASAAAPSSIGAAVVSAASPSVDAPLSGPEVAATAAATAPVSVAASTPSKPDEKKGNGKLVVIGLLAAAAIAAGAFFATRPAAEQPTAQNTAAPTAEAPKAAEPAKPAENTQAAAEPAKEEPSTAAATPAAHGKTPVAHAGGPVAKADTTKDKPEAKEDKKVDAKDLPASQGGGGDLGAAMRAAAGPGAAAEATKESGPQFAAGSVPQKPSQGAITGALGAVLGQARACVAEDDPVSRANVTFASAGNVQSVTVSGGAAGKPAEACIKAALSKAHVAPFAEATYSANVTVRH